MSDQRITPELLAHAIRDDQLMRLRAGDFTGADLAALRRMLRLTQADLAESIGLSIDTLRNWEQDRNQPDGPARVLIRLLATRPGVILRLAKPAA
jgi:DNA-binding transcriptional regulator YiaG